MHPRLTPANGRVALLSLKGQVRAERFTDGALYEVTAPLADLLRTPNGALDRQLLRGGRFLVLEKDEETGFGFGQSQRDGYVGYVAQAALGPPGDLSHKVSALGSHIYPEPDIKTLPLTRLTFGCEVAVDRREGEFFRLQGGGYIPVPHLQPLGQTAPDFVAVFERFLGVPYLWGGNSTLGMDCSGALQLALHAAGRDCPRDTDMQVDALGQTTDPGDLKRGDLIFWLGHIGVMRDQKTLIHANAFHMAVASEPLAEAVARIKTAGEGDVTAVKRL
jgi:NlpC/P60 family protein/dipeptidyl peptidase-like protein